MIKFISILILTISLASGNLFASGGSSGNDGGNDAAVKYYQNRYDLGKRVMETKVLCGACPFAGTELNGEGVQLIAMQLKKMAYLMNC